jgi:hypothetical protein
VIGHVSGRGTTTVPVRNLREADVEQAGDFLDRILVFVGGSVEGTARIVGVLFLGLFLFLLFRSQERYLLFFTCV